MDGLHLFICISSPNQWRTAALLKLSRKLTDFCLFYRNVFAFLTSVSQGDVHEALKNNGKRGLPNQSKKADVTETTVLINKGENIFQYWSASVHRGTVISILQVEELWFSGFKSKIFHLRFVEGQYLFSADSSTIQYIPDSNTAILLVQMYMLNTTHSVLSIRKTVS